MEVHTRFPLKVHIYHMHMFTSSSKVNKMICVPSWNGTYTKMCHNKRISKIQQLPPWVYLINVIFHALAIYYLYVNVFHKNRLGFAIK